MPRKTKAQIEAELFAQQEEATIQAKTEEVSLEWQRCRCRRTVKAAAPAAKGPSAPGLGPPG